MGECSQKVVQMLLQNRSYGNLGRSSASSSFFFFGGGEGGWGWGGVWRCFCFYLFVCCYRSYQHNSVENKQ